MWIMDQRFGKLNGEWQKRIRWKKQIKGSKGKILQDSEEILKEYEQYYRQLLTTRKPENTAVTFAEDQVKKEFESVIKQKKVS